MTRNEATSPFDSGLNSENGEHVVRGRYLIHDSVILVVRFFFGPKKKRNNDLNLLDQAKILLESRNDAMDKGTVELCKKLIHVHRVHENTKSRKRLEIWATIVISLYLVLICLIFVLNSLKTKGGVILECNPNLMIALLTTTTVNILGLVVIVLKGYFPQNTLDDNKQDDK